MDSANFEKWLAANQHKLMQPQAGKDDVPVSPTGPLSNSNGNHLLAEEGNSPSTTKEIPLPHMSDLMASENFEEWLKNNQLQFTSSTSVMTSEEKDDDEGNGGVHHHRLSTVSEASTETERRISTVSTPTIMTTSNSGSDDEVALHDKKNDESKEPNRNSQEGGSGDSSVPLASPAATTRRNRRGRNRQRTTPMPRPQLTRRNSNPTTDSERTSARQLLLDMPSSPTRSSGGGDIISSQGVSQIFGQRQNFVSVPRGSNSPTGSCGASSTGSQSPIPSGSGHSRGGGPNRRGRVPPPPVSYSKGDRPSGVGAFHATDRPIGVIPSRPGAFHSTDRPIGVTTTGRQPGAFHSTDRPIGVTPGRPGAFHSTDRPIGVTPGRPGAFHSTDRPIGVTTTSTGNNNHLNRPAVITNRGISAPSTGTSSSPPRRNGGGGGGRRSPPRTIYGGNVSSGNRSRTNSGSTNNTMDDDDDDRPRLLLDDCMSSARFNDWLQQNSQDLESNSNFDNSSTRGGGGLLQDGPLHNSGSAIPEDSTALSELMPIFDRNTVSLGDRPNLSTDDAMSSARFQDWISQQEFESAAPTATSSSNSSLPAISEPLTSNSAHEATTSSPTLVLPRQAHSLDPTNQQQEYDNLRPGIFQVNEPGMNPTSAMYTAAYGNTNNIDDGNDDSFASAGNDDGSGIVVPPPLPPQSDRMTSNEFQSWLQRTKPLPKSDDRMTSDSFREWLDTQPSDDEIAAAAPPTTAMDDRMTSEAFQSWLQRQQQQTNSSNTVQRQIQSMLPSTSEEGSSSFPQPTPTPPPGQPSSPRGGRMLRGHPALRRSSSLGSLHDTMSSLPPELRPSEADMLHHGEIQNRDLLNESEHTHDSSSAQNNKKKKAIPGTGLISNWLVRGGQKEPNPANVSANDNNDDFVIIDADVVPAVGGGGATFSTAPPASPLIRPPRRLQSLPVSPSAAASPKIEVPPPPPPSNLYSAPARMGHNRGLRRSSSVGSIRGLSFNSLPAELRPSPGDIQHKGSLGGRSGDNLDSSGRRRGLLQANKKIFGTAVRSVAAPAKLLVNGVAAPAGKQLVKGVESVSKLVAASSPSKLLTPRNKQKKKL